MKFKLKAIAVAATLVTAGGAAQAVLTDTLSNNGSFALVAWDSVSLDWYARDLGFLMNDFIPSGITTLSGNGGVTGTASPAAGLTRNGSTTPSFADPVVFGAWLSTVTAANVQWMVGSYDNQGLTTGVNVHRAVFTSKDPSQTVTNGQLSNFGTTGNFGGTVTLFDSGTGSGISRTAIAVNSPIPQAYGQNFGLGPAGVPFLGETATLYYGERDRGTGGTTLPALITAYGNAAGNAVLSLSSTGELTYVLSPVPMPASVWLMGAGLLAVGGVLRRRKAAAAAV